MEWISIMILLGICFSSLSLLLHMYEVPEEPLKIRKRFEKDFRDNDSDSR